MSRISNKFIYAVVCLAIALATVAVYQNIRNNDFIDFDDNLYVTANTGIQKGFTSESLKWAFTTNQAYNWHPLTWLSHTLDFQLFGLNAAGHHIINLLWHIANTLLLFVLLLQMTGSRWRSVLVAVLFAVHPLHVESVAWVSERKDVLSAFFFFLTIWFYVLYTKRPKVTTYLPIIISFALGLMAKQMLVTLPFVLLLLDYWPLNRLVLSKEKNETVNASPSLTLSRCLFEKIPLIVLSIVASLIVLGVQSKAALVKSTMLIPVGYRIGNSILAYAEYIIKMFYPVHLGILYPHPETNIQIWQVALAGLSLFLITIAVLCFSRNQRWLAVGWLWYLGTLIPVIGLVQVGLQAMADRYTYIPLTGLFIIIAWGSVEVTEKLRRQKVILGCAALIAIIFLSVLTYRQVSYWKDSITLFRHTAEVTRNNDIMHFHLGGLLLRRGDVDGAIYHWGEAVRIRPAQPTIHKNIALLFAQKGDIDKAIYHYREALKYKPDDVLTRDAIQKLLTMRQNTSR